MVHRREQMKVLKWIYSVVFVGIQGLSNLVPWFMPIISFAVYTAINGKLDASVIFPALVIFANLNEPLYQSTRLVQRYTGFQVSQKRFEDFMASSENSVHKTSLLGSSDTLNSEGIQFVNFSAKYEEIEDAKEEQPSSAFSLEKIDLEIQKGDLVIIIGKSGSGKSSLLASVVGCLKQTAGTVKVNGNIGYYPQQPWVYTGSVKENILFCSDEDTSRLKKVLSGVRLESDLKSMPNGIDTAVGESGVNLSGGQKARVALARTLYKDRDIYLFDDPLSALDAKVSSQVFEFIKTKLKKKTVLLVTHQLNYLPLADKIVVMEDGKIVEVGKYTELVGLKGHLHRMVENYDFSETLQTNELIDNTEEEHEASNSKVNIIESEERRTGRTTKKVLFTYFNALGFGLLTLWVVCYIATLGLNVATNYYLMTATQSLPNSFILTYTLLGTASGISLLLLSLLVALACLKASSVIHNEALQGLFRSPISFFESQPIGRILSRMTRDVSVADKDITGALSNISEGSLFVISSLILMSQAGWQIFIVVLIVTGLFYIVFNYFQTSNRELKRLTSLIRSPMDAHVSESLSGALYIRSYALEKEYFQKNHQLLDDFLAVQFITQSAEIWSRFRFRLLTCLFTLSIVVIGEFLRKGDPTVASSIGLALTQAVTISEAIYNFMMYLGIGEAEVIMAHVGECY
jgi:ABC-type multidrug transport system fused ATPase/permease subunit